MLFVFELAKSQNDEDMMKFAPRCEVFERNVSTVILNGTLNKTRHSVHPTGGILRVFKRFAWPKLVRKWRYLLHPPAGNASR
jgi:hypothetical protein